MRRRGDSPRDLPDTGTGEIRRDLFDVCEKAARGALAENTERALRSDLAIFTAWCDEHGESTLPASAQILVAFIEAMARERAPATVRRYVASIAAAHRAIDAEETTKCEAVRRALQRMDRRKGTRQAQAKGVTCTLRLRLLQATGDGLIDARNRALLAVGYDTLLRRSELVALEVPDIVEEMDGTATVLVRRGKTDPGGQGAEKYLAPDSMGLVKEWLKRSDVGEGKLFRSLSRGEIGEVLGPGEVSRIYKRMARDAGLPSELVEQISGHSTRVGATQDMVAAGIGTSSVVQTGGWKTSRMVHRYAERVLAQQSGAAQLARIQQRG